MRAAASAITCNAQVQCGFQNAFQLERQEQFSTRTLVEIGAAIALRKAQAALRSRGFALEVPASGTGVGDRPGTSAMDESTRSRAILDGWNRALAKILNDFGSALGTSLAASGLPSRGCDATAWTNRTPAREN